MSQTHPLFRIGFILVWGYLILKLNHCLNLAFQYLW